VRARARRSCVGREVPRCPLREAGRSRTLAAVDVASAPEGCDDRDAWASRRGRAMELGFARRSRSRSPSSGGLGSHRLWGTPLPPSALTVRVVRASRRLPKWRVRRLWGDRSASAVAWRVTEATFSSCPWPPKRSVREHPRVSVRALLTCRRGWPC